MKKNDDKLPPWLELKETIKVGDVTVFTATQHGKPVIVFPEDVSDDQTVTVLEYLRDEGWLDDILDDD